MTILRLLGLVGLSAFFVGCGSEVAETPSGTTLWAHRFGRGSNIEPVGLAGVESGGVIVTGRHYGEVNLGGGMLPAPGNNYQAYVARYDGEGQHVYSRSFGDAFAEMSNDVAVLPDGSAFLAGSFNFSFELDGTTLPYDGGDDAFVAKLDPAGKVVWAQAFGGGGSQQATAIAAMPDGGAIVAGRLLGATDLGIGNPQEYSVGAFVIRLDAKGTPSWVQILRGGDGLVNVEDIAVQGNAIAVVGNSSSSALDVGLDMELVMAGYDGFVATYDLDGKARWARRVGVGTFGPRVKGVAFMADGGLVLTGEADGNVDFGGGVLPVENESDSNTYLLELDAASNHRRSVLYGGEGFDRGQGIAVTAGGGVVLTGEMIGRMSFGEASVASHEDEYQGDVFVAALDAERNPVFVRRFGDMSLQSGQRVAVDGQGRVYVAGSAIGVVDFGQGPTEASGYFETFVVALAP
ncbi:hypothetical protein [Polyangium sorediatum]|uniref:Uncharacterized protein n=1 Tax=Polyangium sorediatum TaxID=889274 RepID=A0ABT6P8P7_9BACT|nr:hypothetical protein [Polyangium sorediatum]MDI1436990.1 hypothetical protein [Polyangium sorediatum]